MVASCALKQFGFSDEEICPLVIKTLCSQPTEISRSCEARAAPARWKEVERRIAAELVALTPEAKLRQFQFPDVGGPVLYVAGD
jgi:hypothetical protein